MSAVCPLKNRHNIRYQQGIALVMVLWLLVLMTVIASSHSRNVRTETRLASNYIESGKARNLAEAGVYRAIMEMLVKNGSDRWTPNGSINSIRFENGEAAITIRDARGLVDINSARGPLLDNLLAGAGIVDDQQRQQLTDAILDWRDKDSLKHLHGAEDEDYRRAGLSWAPRDDLFTSVEEFRYVMGMTNPLFAKLEPYLTVHSGAPGIKFEFAPPWLVSVLGNDRTVVPDAKTATVISTGTFHVNVLATTNSGTHASLGAVVRIAARGNQPYKILSWRSPARLPVKNSG